MPLTQQGNRFSRNTSLKKPVEKFRFPKATVKAIAELIQISLEVETIKAMKSTDDKSLCIRDDGMKPLEGFQPLFPVITNDYLFMLVAELTKTVVNFEAVGFD